MKKDSEGGLIWWTLSGPHNFIPLSFASWGIKFFISLSGVPRIADLIRFELFQVNTLENKSSVAHTLIHFFCCCKMVIGLYIIFLSVHFSSVAQSCPTLCDPMNCSMPGLPVHHQLPEYTNSCPLTRCCHPTISSSVFPFSSCPQFFPASGSFQMSQLLPSGGQSIGVSASTWVLSMNTQDWPPLGWTGWISSHSKGL